MVKRGVKIRVGADFVRFRNSLKQSIGDVSDTQLTDGIARFLDEEALTPIMIRRAQRKKKGGLF